MSTSITRIEDINDKIQEVQDNLDYYESAMRQGITLLGPTVDNLLKRKAELEQEHHEQFVREFEKQYFSQLTPGLQEAFREERRARRRMREELAQHCGSDIAMLNYYSGKAP